MNLGQVKRELEKVEAQRAPRAPFVTDAELARETARCLDWVQEHPDDEFAEHFAGLFVEYLRECQTQLNPPASPELEAELRRRLLPPELQSVEDLI